MLKFYYLWYFIAIVNLIIFNFFIRILSLFFVDSLMLRKLGFLLESFTTIWAIVGFLTCVDSEMILKIALFEELSLTDTTHEDWVQSLGFRLYNLPLETDYMINDDHRWCCFSCCYLLGHINFMFTYGLLLLLTLLILDLES